MKTRYFLLILLATVLIAADPPKVVEKTFTGIKSLEVKLASSDCLISEGKGPEVKVRVEYTYPTDQYQPLFEPSGDRLVLREDFSHSWFGSLHGKCTWRVEAPKGTQIDMRMASGDTSIEGGFVLSSLKAASGDVRLSKVSSSGKIVVASGDVEIEDVTGGIIITTASGDVNGRRLKGEPVAITAASGDIELINCQGGFEVTVASGDVVLREVEIDKPSIIKSASGDIQVKLAKSAIADITIKVASGDILLSYGGQPLKGTFELLVKKDNGSIDCPVAFDKVEEVMEGGHVYIKKTFTRLSSTPRIVLKAHSGSVELRE